jgi:hypothetical protein
MVDFNKMLEELRASWTPEERKHRDTYRRLKEENTFYTTTTMLDNEYLWEKHQKAKEEKSCEVKLYCHVDRHSLEIYERPILSFEAPREYEFNKKFLEETMIRFLTDPKVRFDIETLSYLYVKHDEVVRIITEATNALEEHGLLEKFGLR